MQFKPCFHRRKIIAHAGGISYYPDQLAKIYGFPPGFDGTGQTVAVIELGGGFVQADLDAYFQGRGQSVKPVKFVGVDGATNSPTTADSADGEVMLDLEVIGGVAPGVQLACYMAPNTDQGFVNAINQAVQDRVNVISISWGAPENQWSASSRAAMDAAMKAAGDAGISVFAAAGDNGSSDGESGAHVDYPASSPYCMGCGGTTLHATAATATAETVWNDGSQGGATGGGVSSVYPLPSWQAKAGVPGGKFRGVPDVAAVADPQTGINVRVDGEDMVIGGTSAVAPFWAGLAAVLNQAIGTPVGFMLPTLYAAKTGFRDITQGNNGTYTAKSGYDCCTGLGVPIGTALLTLFKGTPEPMPLPIITSPFEASATVGQAFQYQILATAHPTIYGAVGLPDGIEINAQSGLLSGTPLVQDKRRFRLSRRMPRDRARQLWF